MQQEQLRFYLGCGMNYFEGYVNVVFPLFEQTAMSPKSDVHKDIRELEYFENFVDEIRSHYLFEYFFRLESIKLLLVRYLKCRFLGKKKKF